MLLGICVPTGQRIGPEVLSQYRDDGVNGVRVKADHLPPLENAHVVDLASEILEYGLQPYVSIRTSDQAAALFDAHDNVLVSLGNEPDIAENGWTLNRYRAEADRCVAVAEEMGRRVYLGCLSNTRREQFRKLRQIWRDEWKTSDHVGADMHCYSDPERFGEPIGYHSWDAVAEAWHEIVGNVPKMIGETGCHTLGHTLQQQTQWLTLMRMVWEPYCDWMQVYQGFNGNPESANGLDYYGLQVAPGGAKKPAYHALFPQG